MKYSLVSFRVIIIVYKYKECRWIGWCSPREFVDQSRLFSNLINQPDKENLLSGTNNLYIHFAAFQITTKLNVNMTSGFYLIVTKYRFQEETKSQWCVSCVSREKRVIWTFIPLLWLHGYTYEWNLYEQCIIQQEFISSIKTEISQYVILYYSEKK